MRQLKLDEVGYLPNTRGRSIGLFITDRCPVGCAHCSVDSRPDSPSISDFALFEAIIDEIRNRPEVEMVGITGGEPFVERRGLALATERLADSKHIVIYTSGVWANAEIPDWIRKVLRRASCVFLSTDSFHAASIDDERFIRAARTIAEEAAWMVVQVLDIPAMVQRAERLLDQAFGDRVTDYVEFKRVIPLSAGRGEKIFLSKTGERWPGEVFPACDNVSAQMIRYDGIVTACCNEHVLMGWGSPRLRRQCKTREELREALDLFGADPLLQVVHRMGVGALTMHPKYADLAKKEFRGMCDLCWAMQRRADPLGDRSDRLLNAMAVMGGQIDR